MYYKIFGYATSNVSIDVAQCNEYTGAPQKWIAGEGGDTFVKDYTWRKYTRRYVIDTTGYYFFAPVLQRNGRVQFSEIQLEEGTNATGWQDPDIVDSVERTGIDLVNGTVSVEAANFEIKHNGEKPFVVSKGRALLGGWVFDKGRLFSQCGDVDGNPSRDYANPRFNPDNQWLQFILKRDKWLYVGRWVIPEEDVGGDASKYLSICGAGGVWWSSLYFPSRQDKRLRYV